MEFSENPQKTPRFLPFTALLFACSVPPWTGYSITFILNYYRCLDSISLLSETWCVILPQRPTWMNGQLKSFPISLCMWILKYLSQGDFSKINPEVIKIQIHYQKSNFDTKNIYRNGKMQCKKQNEKQRIYVK